MKRLIVILLMFVIGCHKMTPQEMDAYVKATDAQEQAEKDTKLKRESIITGPAPTCKEQTDCALKWSRARRWVLANSATKIQTYSDDYIETYNTTSRMSGNSVRVEKDLQADGSSKIIVTIGGVFPLLYSETELGMRTSFYRYVNGEFVDPKWRPGM